jgi:hypothetical protein
MTQVDDLSRCLATLDENSTLGVWGRCGIGRSALRARQGSRSRSHQAGSANNFGSRMRL